MKEGFYRGVFFIAFPSSCPQSMWGGTVFRVSDCRVYRVLEFQAL